MRGADALDQCDAFVAIEVTVVIVEVIEFRVGFVFELVVTTLQSPHVRPMCGRRVVGAEKIIGAGDPLVQILLHQPARNHAGFGDTGQTGVAGTHVEGLFTQHIAHRAAQRRKRRILEHL